MACIALRDCGRYLELILCSSDHSVFDFAQISMPMEPSSAALLQLVHREVQCVDRISQSLLAWPFRHLYSSKLTFRQLYLYHQVISNVLEILFGIMFLATLQRRLSKTGSSVLSSLGQLQYDLARAFTFASQSGNTSELSFLEFILSYVRSVPLVGFILSTPLFGLHVCWILLDFHYDVFILAVLLPHLLMFWTSVSSLVYALKKTCALFMKAGHLAKKGIRTASSPSKNDLKND
eukprot:TRINITY_DN44111_c0_g1_i1.p1 TRINITY_DN44111_c0_g1~~TRINITY_DN44111_c0_g1_i1.p1  ORF type:complete len:268 (-),score=18.48 TRINITY_DN44111_c0_g1_i1:33-737(-)